jgi:hypothetical protein
VIALEKFFKNKDRKSSCMNRERDNHSFIRKEFGSEAREHRGGILKENLVSQGRKILVIVELCCFAI